MTTSQKPLLPVWKVDNTHPISSVHSCGARLVSGHPRYKPFISIKVCLAGQPHAQMPLDTPSANGTIEEQPAVSSTTARGEPPPPSNPGEEPDAGGPGKLLICMCTSHWQEATIIKHLARRDG